MAINEFYCDRCGIRTKVEGYCTAEDRKNLNDGLPSCAVAMTPDADGKVACWCTSFPSRQFKHKNKLSKKEMDGIQAHCPNCRGTGRCLAEDE